MGVAERMMPEESRNSGSSWIFGLVGCESWEYVSLAWFCQLF